MRPGSDIRKKLFGRTYIRVVICAFIRSAEDEGVRQESQGGKGNWPSGPFRSGFMPKQPQRTFERTSHQPGSRLRGR